jgi:hypothetical protein
MEAEVQLGLFGRTSQVPSAAMGAGTSGQSSTRWLTSGRWTSSGECWTHAGSESPNGVEECSSSLALILEQQVDGKYFLSPKACAGILRRAEKRGKTLPEPLEVALRVVAHGPTLTE